MAVAIDSSGQGVATGFATGPRTVSYSHTVTGSNPVLAMFSHIFQDTAGTGTVTAATYAGVTLTNAIASTLSVNIALEGWYKAGAATGANTLSVTVTGATDGIRISSGSATGISATPLGVTATAPGSSGNPALTIVTGTANSIVFSGLVRFANTAITASTWTNLQRANANNVTMTLDYLITTTAGSQTNTQTGTAAQDWVMGAMEFKPLSGSTFNQSLTAGLSFSGGFRKQTSHRMAASLSFTGAIRRAVSHRMTAVLSFTGVLRKSTSRRLTAALSFVASLASGHRFTQLLTASLSFSGNLVTGSLFTKALTAALSFTGAISKRTNKRLTASLSFTGVFRKQMRKQLTAALNFTGTMNKSTRKTMTSVLSFIGSLNDKGPPPIFTYQTVVIDTTTNLDTDNTGINIVTTDTGARIEIVNTDQNTSTEDTGTGEVTINTNTNQDTL